EALAPDDIRARWPAIRADDLVGAVFEPEAGLLMARRGVVTAAAQAAREGASFELAVVRPGRSDGDRLLEVVDGDGRAWTAETVVFACGPWLPRLFPDVLDDL